MKHLPGLGPRRQFHFERGLVRLFRNVVFFQNEIVAEAGQRQGDGTGVFTAGGGDFEVETRAAGSLDFNGFEAEDKTRVERLDFDAINEVGFATAVPAWRETVELP